MKLKELRSKKDLLEIEIEGEQHALPNLLRDEAYKTGANIAAYKIEHPTTSNPILKVISSKEPKKVLLDAAENITKLTKEFQKKFK